MTPDFFWLIASVALAFVQVLVASGTATAQVGGPTICGNREDMAPLTGLARRAKCAHANMMENLPLVIALVLVVHLSNRVNSVSLFGEQLFFWARLLHAIVYVIGIPWVRTLLWVISLIGMLLIFLQLL